MKKILSILTVMIVLCVTSLSVLAAPVASPSKTVIPQRGTITTMDGKKSEIDNTEDLSKYLIIRDTDKEAENINGYSTVSVFEAILQNITSVEAVVYVPGVKATDTIIIRKYVDGKWVDVKAEVVGDNLIKILFTESTYFEVLKLNTSNNGAVTKPGASATKPGTTSSTSTSTTTKPTGANTSKKAPKTGEGNVLPIACAVFAGCMAGVFVCGKNLRKKVK